MARRRLAQSSIPSDLKHISLGWNRPNGICPSENQQAPALPQDGPLSARVIEAHPRHEKGGPPSAGRLFSRG
jgi:hypothetical protein